MISRLRELIFPPLPCSRETPARGPCLAVPSSVQEMHGPLTVDTEKSCRIHQKAIAPILGKLTERTGVVRPEGEKALGKACWLQER